MVTTFAEQARKKCAAARLSVAVRSQESGIAHLPEVPATATATATEPEPTGCRSTASSYKCKGPVRPKLKGKHARTVDWTGAVFHGRVTAISFLETNKAHTAFWGFHCTGPDGTCGRFFRAAISNVTTGRKKHCGCAKGEGARAYYARRRAAGLTNRTPTPAGDYAGKKFGLLTVVSVTALRTKNRAVIVECDCDCGTKGFRTAGAMLKRGMVKSCGCLVSGPEREVKNLLTKYGVRFTPQAHVFSNPLYRADFYLYELRGRVTETSGIQHFRAVEHWGGAKQLRQQRKRDRIKESELAAMDIPLLIIPYTVELKHFDNFVWFRVIAGAEMSTHSRVKKFKGPIVDFVAFWLEALRAVTDSNCRIAA